MGRRLSASLFLQTGGLLRVNLLGCVGFGQTVLLEDLKVLR